MIGFLIGIVIGAAAGFAAGFGAAWRMATRVFQAHERESKARYDEWISAIEASLAMKGLRRARVVDTEIREGE